MTAVWIAAGIFVIFLVSLDVFTSVVVPRPTRRSWRISWFVLKLTWPLWRTVGLNVRNEAWRESYLGAYAPLFVVGMLAVWVVGLACGYGLIIYALRDQVHPQPPAFADALYFAATSLLTVGFGDFVPTGGTARLVAMVAAGSGLATFAIVIAYLFSLFGSFQRREVFVIVLDSSAGAPPSGVELLATYANFGLRDELRHLFESMQRWAADLLETHLAYPILGFFRSSHRDESWIGTLGAVLDAATLVVTSIEGDGPNAGQARLAIDVGTHLSEDLCTYFSIPFDKGAGIERSEFEAACGRLGGAGFGLRRGDEAWREFTQVRGEYAAALNAIAKYWAIPPAQWIGDRSSIVRH